MPPAKGFKITKDGALLIGSDVATALDEGVKIPQTDTAYGAGFGDYISDSDRAFAAEREPVAHFLTYGVANDITEKWFIINDPETEEADPELDRSAQQVLNELEFKKHLTDAISFSRIFGKALLVCGFKDAQSISALQNPLKTGSELVQFAVYPKTKSGQKINDYQVIQKDEDPTSERFNEPVIYRLDRGGGHYTDIHYSRVCEVKTGTTETSVLDSIWDDVVCGRNIRWGASQWMYRTGGGFPCIGFPAGTKLDQIEAYHNSGAFSNLMSRTTLMYTQNSTTENDGMVIDFKGLGGQALNPEPFFQTNIEQISVATGIPQAKLIGAQAGQVTGSEVNMQDYFKVISREQAKLEPVVRWVINKLSESGQLTLIKTAVDKESYRNTLLKRMLRRVTGDYRHKAAKNYTIEWVSAFELSALAEADVDLKKEQSNQLKLDYMTIDEVRAENQLDPLPNGEGEKLKQASMGLFGENKGQEGNPELAEADKFLVVDLNRSKKEHIHE